MSDPCKYPSDQQIEKLWERTDEARSRVDKLEIELKFHSQSVRDTQKSVDRLNEKFDEATKEIKADLKEMLASMRETDKTVTQATGVAKAMDWLTERWIGLAAMAAAIIAFLKSGV